MANYNLQLWSSEFAANLFETNDWFKVAKDWSKYSKGNIVHIPQAASGSVAVAVDGSTSLPVGVTKKTFGDLTFTVTNLVAEPRAISLDQDEANTFEGRTALSQEMVDELKQGVSMTIAYGLQPASAAIATSGATTRTNIYGKASVKALTYNDVLAARTKLSKDKASLNNLYMIVDSVLYADLLKMDEFKTASQLGDSVTVSGYVGQIAGIKVIERPLGLAYTSGGAKPSAINYGDAYANTHFSAALVFDATKVGFATSETKVGIDEFATGFYGDVMQARTRVGASALFESGKGVVAIIEAV